MKSFWHWLTASRKRIFFVSLLILLILDAGRSLYARVGYAAPAEPWNPAPYQALSWPPSADALPADATLGARVYAERCALCHGPDGQGDGPAAPSMIPRPRDFTLGQYKYKTTPADQPPSDEDLARVIRDGLHASAMPYFGDILSDEEITALVEHLKTLSPVFDRATPTSIEIPAQPTTDSDSLTRGATLFQQNCIACHGTAGQGTVPLTDAKGYPVISRDLTAPWTFRGGSTPEDIYRRITTGLAPGPMPSFAETLTEAERWDVVNYVTSLARPAPWETGGTLGGPGQSDSLQTRGEYLTHLEMCGLCHTQVSANMIYSADEYYLAGGMAVPAYPQGTFISRNLTSDKETGLGNWTVEQVASAIRDGKGKDRNLNFWGMPWMYLHSFEQDDALAIATYLKTLPPVTNRIPAPLKYGFVESFVQKIAYSTGIPPLGTPKALVYKMGNYGETDPGLLPRVWPQSVLIWFQYLTLAGGLIAFVFTFPAEKRRPHGVRGWQGTIFTFLGLGTLLFVVWVMYSTPVLPFIPAEIINQAVTSAIYQPDLTGETPEDTALIERGRYLYTVTSCAFCHGNQGEGGAKVNQASFGTVWVRNISSDPEFGIGAWTDAEVGRAIRSGVSRDGGPLHWQGMVWDHLSNLDEEDLCAIIAYLRTLPAVANEIPSPVPPSANDCTEYTFFTVPSLTPGCEP
ncbi:MAG TPA: c-type cytochrome [Anaerolineales bacterium]|nr:c-type cytochrome [Anaerolineales bacterium]